MERSLFSFIWKFSKRDQIFLVLVTLLLFPLLYLSLELPKRIINDAIGGQPGAFQVFGYAPDKKELLIGFCIAFLLSVLAHGLLKMRVNTMKGVVAERLLRRFRYTLIGRILRFPPAYQSRLSEGELTAMITAETEPLGGLMGDAVAQPLLQAGQMLTILLFLFLQSVWFGLAAVALIPMQAWLIPRMQKKINVLNRSRIKQVRLLAGEIGEMTSGAATIRQNSGWRYRMAKVSSRLAGLFETRFEIYQRKFFMKFVNNFLTQLTPFIFFLVGGFLVIDGLMTVGALVAALSAFKDLSSPWKELLTYYTRMMEMSQRYHLIADRFAPLDILPDFLDEKTDDQTVLEGSLEFQRVTLQDSDSQTVLNAADFTAEAGSWTLIVAEQPYDQSAFAQMLTRERKALGGKILIGGQSLHEMPQAQAAASVGHVTSTPYMFDGTVGENVLMPRFQTPGAALPSHDHKEAKRTGNSTDLATGEWPLGADSARLAEELLRLAVSTGAQKGLISRSLDRRMVRGADFKDQLVAMRPRVIEALEGRSIVTFHRDEYVDSLTVAENLFFGIAAEDGWFDEATTAALNDVLGKLGIRGLVLRQSIVMAETLVEAFDMEAEASPLFQQIGLPADMLTTLHRVVKHTGTDIRSTKQIAADEAILMSLVLNLPAIRFDRTFSVFVKSAIVGARKELHEVVTPALQAQFVPLNWEEWNPRLTLLENLAFGKFSTTSRARQEEIKTVMTKFLARELDSEILGALIRDLPTGRHGSGLPAEVLEVLSLGQTVVKGPSIVVLEHAMASHDDETRNKAFAAIRAQLPNATVLQIEPEMPKSELHDRVFELGRGQLLADGDVSEEDMQSGEGSELQRKVQAIRRAALFSGLSSRQLRMLAFSAQWVDVPEGEFVFRQNDAPDGAYLIYQGQASLLARGEDGEVNFEVTPDVGALVGELGLIKKDARRLDMLARTPLVLLRIESEDFLPILENDSETAFKLIQVLIGYLDSSN